MTAEKSGNTTHHGPVFGDHATFIYGDGNGVGGRNDPAAPPRTGRWARPGKIVVGVATVVGTIFTVLAFWAVLDDKDAEAPASGTGTKTGSRQEPLPQTTSPDAEAAPDTEAAPEAAPGTVFDDVVTIDFGTGYDLDGGRPRELYRQDADTDLFVASSYSLSSSARHSAMHSDTAAGDESGAYERCRRYRLSGGSTTPTALVYAGAQYCFTSSNNHPGWFQVVNQLDGAFLVKAVIWSGTTAER